jgi:hypothetical protein
MTRETIDETKARLRAALSEELHEIATGYNRRDAMLASQEIESRKSAQRYRLPRVSNEKLAAWLVGRAYAEFGSVFPPVAELLSLVERRKRGERIDNLLARVEELLRRAYAGSDARLARPEPGEERATAPEAEPRAPSKWDRRADLA